MVGTVRRGQWAAVGKRADAKWYNRAKWQVAPGAVAR